MYYLVFYTDKQNMGHHVEKKFETMYEAKEHFESILTLCDPIFAEITAQLDESHVILDTIGLVSLWRARDGEWTNIPPL